MITIQRANVVLQVENDLVEYYVGKGFNVIDDKGEVIREAIPTDLALLKAKYIEQKELIDKLENENVKLKEQLKVKENKPKTKKK